MSEGYENLKQFANDLENSFFLKEDQKLIEKLREMKKMEETKQNLAQVSGIQNDKILQALVDMDIHAEIVAALTVVPLIEVAWADGKMEDKEKEAVLKGAGSSGISEDESSYTLLKQWLEHHPGPDLLEARAVSAAATRNSQLIRAPQLTAGLR